MKDFAILVWARQYCRERAASCVIPQNRKLETRNWKLVLISIDAVGGANPEPVVVEVVARDAAADLT